MMEFKKVDSRIPMKMNKNEQIDQLVYELYGLSEEEIGIVENS